MKTQTQFKIVLLIATAALMTACGTEKQMSSSDFASRTTGAVAATTDQSTKPLAYCNKGTSSLMSANLGIFTRGDQIASDKIYVKITNVPAAFSQSQNYIQFFGWQTNSSGYSSGADHALYFDIIDMTTNTYLAQNKKSLYWTDLQALAQRVQTTNPADFFKKVRILVNLEDPDAELDVLRMDYFDMNNAKVDRLDALLPIFSADPTQYAVDSNGMARPSNLQALHPFKSMIGQGWSANKFKSEAQKFCAPLNTTAY